MKKTIVLLLICFSVFSSGYGQKATKAPSPSLEPDSTKAQPVAEIDSAKVIVPQAVVTYKEDTLFAIFGPYGPFSADERATVVAQRLQRILDISSFTADSLYVVDGETSSDIFFQEQILLSVTDADAVSLGKSRSAVAQQICTYLRDKITHEFKLKTILDILVKIGLTILELLIIYLLIKYLNKLFGFTRLWLVRQKETLIKGIRIKGYELLDTDRALRLSIFANNVLRWLVIIFVLYLAIPILFSIFPWTRGLADRLFGYVLSPVKNIVGSVGNYIPNLFTIAVIYLATRYAIRFIKFLAEEIEKGALQFPGFYPDWAMPTFNIVRMLLYAFMFIVIFPYLPGSDSPVFQGVSVFLGVLFSLGSSSAISNAVAGLVITYMRPFKKGDRIKIGEIVGEVIEKSILVTRVRTIKNEQITIPNSTVLSGHTTNYTTSAKDLGLILHTSITIGYDVPWKQVHTLLTEAGLATSGVLQADGKRPFVLQTSLDDFYVSYQLNVYTEESNRMAAIYSELHQHIQDKFNDGGVEILSPHYRAARDGNMTTIPPHYLPPDYQAPTFHVTQSRKKDTE